MKTYIIFTTPRTGSYLLCDLFSQTKALGKPNEFLNPVLQPRYFEKWNITSTSTVDYINSLVENTSSRNGVFGIKITARQLREFEEKMMKEFPDQKVNESLEKVFPNVKFIRLIREDKIKQAISLAKAQQNKVWRLNKDADGPKRIDQVYYSEKEIKKALGQILKQETYLDQVIALCGQKPITFSYEQIVSETPAVLRDSLEYLDVSSKVDISTIQPGTKKLSNSQSSEWYQTFLDNNKKWADKRINKYMRSIEPNQ